jgi:3-dehydroquinate dehydratase-2
LNLLGKRDTSVYGITSFEAFFEMLKQEYDQVEMSYYQSNVEGEFINKQHEAGHSYDAIVMNAGAYTHPSVGMGDAIAGIEGP